MGSRNESADCTTKCDENHDPFLLVSSGRRLNFGFLIISELERMIFLYRQIREALNISRTFSSAAPRRMYSEYPCLSSLSVKEYNMLSYPVEFTKLFQIGFGSAEFCTNRLTLTHRNTDMMELGVNNQDKAYLHILI